MDGIGEDRDTIRPQATGDLDDREGEIEEKRETKIAGGGHS